MNAAIRFKESMMDKPKHHVALIAWEMKTRAEKAEAELAKSEERLRTAKDLYFKDMKTWSKRWEAEKAKMALAIEKIETMLEYQERMNHIDNEDVCDALARCLEVMREIQGQATTTTEKT